MKSRAGFVTNSSSSSFIASGNINTVAMSMFQTWQDDYLSSWGGGDKYDETYNYVMELRDKLLEAIKEGKTALVLPSINYYTYIVEQNENGSTYCMVDTSNNHDWEVDKDHSITWPEMKNEKFYNIMKEKEEEHHTMPY